jgi:hypothetical protein
VEPAYAILTPPAQIDTSVGLDLWTRVEVMARQASPLPSAIVVPLSSAQWSGITDGLVPDVARQVVQLYGAAEVDVLWDTSVQLEPGLTWELDSIAEGWWYADDPSAGSAAAIGPGPQYGQSLGSPNFLLADYLFSQGSWGWLFVA